MRSLSATFVTLACAAAVMTFMPATAQAQKKTKDQAYAECQAELGRGTSGDARKQQFQACMKKKMQGK
jgi:hypothetical protein